MSRIYRIQLFCRAQNHRSFFPYNCCIELIVNEFYIKIYLLLQAPLFLEIKDIRLCVIVASRSPNRIFIRKSLTNKVTHNNNVIAMCINVNHIDAAKVNYRVRRSQMRFLLINLFIAGKDKRNTRALYGAFCSSNRSKLESTSLH